MVVNNVIQKVKDIFKRLSEWVKSTLDKLNEYYKLQEEKRRTRKFSILIIKLFKLDPIVTKLRKNKKDYIWEINYKYKYLFERDE